MKIKKLLTQAVLLTLILYGFYYLEHELKRENTLPLLSIFSLLFILYMLIVEWTNREKKHGLESLPSNIIVRYSIYIVTCLLTLEYFYGEIPFIYFQF